MTEPAVPQGSERFSVVIASRDRAEEVERLVSRLRSMRAAPDQIIVVDDGSTDDTVERLRSLPEPPTVVLGSGEGPATARNRGAARADGRWLVFLDDDDMPDDDWMQELRSLSAAHPDAAHLSVAFRRRWQRSTTTMRPTPLGPAFSRVTANFIAGTFAVRRDLFHDVGGFLDDLRCMEFTDLAIRTFAEADRRNLEIRASPRSTITTFVRPPAERVSQEPATLEASWERVRERNQQHFARDRPFDAAQSATVAVAWFRAGDFPRGRRWMLRACRTHLTARNALRLAASFLPPVRRRAWTEPSAGAARSPGDAGPTAR